MFAWKKTLNLGLQKTFDTLMYKHSIFLTFHIENRNKTIRIETTFRKKYTTYLIKR